MPITTEAKKPFYAVVGVYTKAYETTREIPARAGELRSKARTFVTELPSDLRGKLTVSSLRDEAKTRSDRARAFYVELATAGESLVSSIRRNPATVDAKKSVKTAKASAKDAVTSAKKVVDATAEAVESAADTIL